MFDPRDDTIPTPSEPPVEEPFEGASSEWDPILRSLYLRMVAAELAKNRIH